MPYFASAATIVAAHGASLVGKVYLITGASNGIGLECAKALAAGGATVVLACRAGSKAEAAAAAVTAAAATAPVAGTVHALAVDLGDVESVKSLAAAFLALNLPLHGLINNAGCNGVPLWAAHSPGIETQFAVNVVSQIQLTELLHAKLKATPGARVVNVASEAHRRIVAWEPVPPPEATYEPLRAYAFSNLCRILWTRAKAAELAKRGTPYPIVCLHPGVAGGTGMLQHMTTWLTLKQVWLVLRNELSGAAKGQNVAQIAACQTYAALAPSEELAAISGSYLNGNLNPKVAEGCAWAALKPLGTPCEPTALATSDEHAAEVLAFGRKHCGLRSPSEGGFGLW